MKIFAAVLLASTLIAPVPTVAFGQGPAGYPEGVVKAGLQAVFDRRPGPTGPLTAKLTGVLPKGTQTLVANTYAAKGGAAMKNVEGVGAELYVNGGAFSFDNFRLSAPNGGLYILAAGHGNGGGAPAQLTLSNGIVDQANSNQGKGSLLIGTGSRLDAKNVSFLHASETNLQLAGDSTLTNVYFDSPGQNPSPPSHTEGPHVFAGRHVWTGVFFDARGWAGRHTNATGLAYVEAANADADVTINDSIFMGARGIDIFSPIQVAGRSGHRATLRLNNVVLEAGTHGDRGARYIISTGATTVIAVNCRDAKTGENIDKLLNRQTN